MEEEPLTVVSVGTETTQTFTERHSVSVSDVVTYEHHQQRQEALIISLQERIASLESQLASLQMLVMELEDYIEKKRRAAAYHRKRQDPVMSHT